MAHLIDLETKARHSMGLRTLIGRDSACEVRIDDPLVSASHAEIVCGEDGGFEIRDLGSRRGTFLGSRKIGQSPLHDGDEILIGVKRLRFEASATPSGSGNEELVQLRAIVELGRAIGVEHDLKRLLGRVLETCFQLMRASRGAIVVYQPGSKTPFMTVTKSRIGHDDFEVSTSVLSQIMVSHEPYLTSEFDHAEVLQRSESLLADGVRSVIAVPLKYQAEETEWLGVIQLDSRAITTVFGPGDLELLTAIAGPAALAIKNAMLVRRVQDVISDEAQRLERIVRDLPLGVVVIDEHQLCVMTNRWVGFRQASFELIRAGAVIEQIAGLSYQQLSAGDLQTEVADPQAQKTFSISANTTSDGRETVVVIVDVTVERERQTQAAHRDRIAMVGQLAGGIAHDFNNLLVVILNYAELLGDTLEEPSALDDVREIRHAARSAAALTRQLLTFSRRELVKPTVVDVASAVHEMENLLRRSLGEKVELVTTIASEIPKILIDRAQLEQILMNLVVNARDATPEGGAIQLSVDAIMIGPDAARQRAIVAGRYVVIEVSDRGIGIAPGTLKRIFEPYFTTKGVAHGTGLGLATVHGIVQQARGDILVDSVLGQGTTFRVYLPATDRVDAARLEKLVKPGAGTILVVDDDDNVRRLTGRLLQNAGYEVLSATSGQQALTVAHDYAGQIDLLLTDVVMPGMSGRELAAQLLRVRPTVRMVFMSGYHEHAPMSGSTFVGKPFDRATLLERVRDVLASDTTHTTSSELEGE